VHGVGDGRESRHEDECNETGGISSRPQE
jgi:hypothetical protein